MISLVDDIRYYAHSAPPGGEAEPLAEHSSLVSERSAGFAAAFGLGPEASVCGLIHDAGKASDRFRLRLEGKASGLDHWTPGACLALRHYRQHGQAVALAVQGHHLGLVSAAKSNFRALHELRASDGRTSTVDEPGVLEERLRAAGIELPELHSSIYHPANPHAALLLDVRMLFSTLVDADFLETEAHFDRDERGERRYRPPPPELRPGRALEIVEAEVARLAQASRGRSSPVVQTLRADLHHSALAAAELPPGPFTLSAPTGSGKTLSMLAFALRHAALHGFQRVVMAVPYLSILEQTAGVYRDLLEPVFGAGYVLEHHSLAGNREGRPADDEQGPDAAEVLRRRQAENWDAPLVVTTSVQLLESLHAHRPARCRKLHRLARSVVLFDEVQTLPRPLAVATLATLSRLAERYAASVVFSTATQPAFDHLDTAVGKWCAAGWKPRELVPAELELFARLDRVEVDWRLGDWTPADRLPWERLADELAARPQVLAIFNLKRHARDVAERLKRRGVDGLFHLSTAMCPAHRQQVLAEVKQRLAERLPCRLVSTQCVEAGVDVDFPVVYRAFAPLDALAQAAGRCNRNDLLPEPGRLVVFLPDEREEKTYPSGDYRQAADVTRELLSTHDRGAWNLQDPRLFDAWYRRLYHVGGLGEEGNRRQRELAEAMTARDFERVARLYRLIPDDAVSVVVPWDREGYAALRRASEDCPWVTADWMRQAQLHAVALYRSRLDDYRAVLVPAPLGARLPEQRSDDWFFLQDDAVYDTELGLAEAPGLLTA